MKKNLMKRKVRLVLLLLFSIILMMSLTFCGDSGTTGGGNTTHCADNDYPLWCPDVGVCCTPGHAYYCDGHCFESKQNGCAQYDSCYADN